MLLKRLMETLLIKVKDKRKATLLLKLLESLNFVESVSIITNLQGIDSNPEAKLSDTYKGILTSEEGQKLSGHIKQMRSEWN
jgi:hypothetical protein